MPQNNQPNPYARFLESPEEFHNLIKRYLSVLTTSGVVAGTMKQMQEVIATGLTRMGYGERRERKSSTTNDIGVVYSYRVDKGVIIKYQTPTETEMDLDSLVRLALEKESRYWERYLSEMSTYERARAAILFYLLNEGAISVSAAATKIKPILTQELELSEEEIRKRTHLRRPDSLNWGKPNVSLPENPEELLALVDLIREIFSAERETVES